MELQQFIEQSIKELTTALHNSSKEMLESKTGKGIPDHGEIQVTFDIAVTVNENSEKSAGAKINVLGNFGVGGNALAGSSTQQFSRLSFVVPIKISTINSSAYNIK